MRELLFRGLPDVKNKRWTAAALFQRKGDRRAKRTTILRPTKLRSDALGRFSLFERRRGRFVH